ncbi:MAG: TonB-dependent receptor [Bacteroidota bacterium]|nr:TonB-dependent receptor [Bacteroidota bacterium]MDP4253072.1 TonB-dependent receptor [Bacteroidota bacterium]MDP4260219.1 TonB-dependent receptor [Bacteroidota bacterium]
MRKISFTLVLTILFAALSMAQGPGGGQGGRPRGGGPAIGRAYGKVTDSTGQPMANVSALVLKSVTDSVSKKKKLVLIKGMETKANGEFDFEELPIVSPLVVRLSATGYKSHDLPFMIIPASAAPGSTPATQSSANPMGNLPSFYKDLGTVKLVGDVKELSSVTVSAKQPAMRLELDKKVFNVERNIVSAGGTALDVMRNVPSVNVDLDGNVTLRGAAPTIFVDGRPTTLTLDEIPADAIESVEVMTNPSAKYDASGGGAGILNIILKKNRKQGYNGSISAGMDSHGAPNALVSLSARQGKVNLSANGLINGMNGKTTGSTDRSTYLSDTTTQLFQQDLQRNKGHFLFGQFGVDYFVSNKTTLSAGYIKVHGDLTPTDVSQIQTDSLFNAYHSSTYSTRGSNTGRHFDVNGVQLGMKHLFARDGEEWTADASYFGVTAHSTSLYTTDYYSGKPGTPVASTTYSQTVGTAAPAFFTAQTDYTNPLNKNTKLEAGLRASIQNLENDNNTYTLDGHGGSTLDPFGSSNYKSTSRVFAAYVNFTSKIGNFGYALGLRGESSSYSGDLINTGQHFHNTYPVSLFPTLFLSQKLKNDQELQLSATRKVNRPGFFQLIPYTDYSDTLNITRGNPDLVPEFTGSFELSYMKNFKGGNNLLVSAYYKYTQNLITHYQDSGLNPVGKPVLINTYENANNAYTVGAEVTSTNNLTKWWDITANLNIYNSHINTENLLQPSQPALWTWFGKLNSNFKLPANFSIQLTALYQSKTNLPVNQNTNQFAPPGSTTQSSSQGYIQSSYGFDVAVKKSFLKNNAASLTVSMTDIFRTRWADQYSKSLYFSQEYDRLKDPQLLRVVFAYRFGKMDLNLFKRKDMNSQGMGDAGSSL